LFVSQLTAGGLLLASIGVGAAGRLWDQTPAGRDGALTRTARSVAAVSAAVPVLVVIDDADELDAGLAGTLIDNLIERPDGQVLVVAAADPDSGLVRALTLRQWPGQPTDRVQRAEADADMGYLDRAGLAAELCPDLPIAATRRIGQRTQTFAEVFAVASAGLLAELDPEYDAAALRAVDEVIDAHAAMVPPSQEAVILAWAGGVLHARQAGQALAAGGVQQLEQDRWLVRSGSLVRLAGPVTDALKKQVRILPAGVRHRMAAAVLEAALQVGADPAAGLVERVVAWQAAHRSASTSPT
jgi:hypothetical protein